MPVVTAPRSPDHVGMITHALIAAVLSQQPNDQQPTDRSRVHQVASITAEPDSYPERALAFDGLDDFATVPACDAVRYPGTGGWTVEFWVKPVIYPFHGETSIIGQESVGVPGHDPWSVRAHPTHFEFRIDGVQGNSESVRFDLALGVWQHIACAYDNTDNERSLSVYINGELVESRPTGVRMDSRLDPVYLGALTGIHFCGLLDEARLWSAALGADAVIRAMDGRVRPDETDLRAWWSFDDGSPGVAVDRGPHGAHAVLGRPDRPNDPARPQRVVRPRPESR